MFLVACGQESSDRDLNLPDKVSPVLRTNLSETSPLKFLMQLQRTNHFLKPINNKSANTYPYMAVCNPIDKNWISKKDISKLIPYLDSNNVRAIPVFSTLSSITFENHGQSTLANEAYALVVGYRSGTYPPYSSIPLGGDENDLFTLNDSLKKELLNWWQTEGQK